MGKFPEVRTGRKLVGAGDPGSRAVIKCLSLANGQRQLPLVILGPGTGDGARAPLARSAAPVTMSGALWQGSGESRLQLRNSASPGRHLNPRPLAQAPAQRPPSEEGRDSTHEGRRAGGSWEAEFPGPGAQSGSRRRPAALRPGPAARARPARPHAARRPPGWPRFPARLPRAPRRSRSRTRPREQRARAPSLTAGPGARRPGPRCRHRALTRCLRRSAALLLGRRSPPRRPRRSEGCSARPSLSPPPPARAVSLQPP